MINDGVNQYRYDAYNRLSEIKTPSAKIRSFYDAMSRLIRSESPSGTEKFTYAGRNIVEWGRNGKLEGQIIPLERPHQYAHLASNGSDNAPISDVIDSVLGWINSNNNSNISSMRSYDPFGQVIEEVDGQNWPAPFAFGGYMYDDQARIYHLTARCYHPQYGRFLQRDPAGLVDGPNSYVYANHAPGTLIDYWGLDSTSGINWNNDIRAGFGKDILPFLKNAIDKINDSPLGLAADALGLGAGFTGAASEKKLHWLNPFEKAFSQALERAWQVPLDFSEQKWRINTQNIDILSEKLKEYKNAARAWSRAGSAVKILGKVAAGANVISGLAAQFKQPSIFDAPLSWWDKVVGWMNVGSGLLELFGPAAGGASGLLANAGGAATAVEFGAFGTGAAFIGSAGLVVGTFASAYGVTSALAPYIFGDKPIPIFGWNLPWGTSGGRTISVTDDKWFDEEDDPSFFESYVLPEMEKERVSSIRNEMNDWIFKASTF